MTAPRSTGLKRLAAATRFSLAGLRTAWRDETSFRQESSLCVLLLPLGIWLGRTPAERVLLVGSCLLVLVVELLNSSIEHAVDRIGNEPHRLSGQAKDLGSAAVLVSLVLALVTWGLIAWARFGPGA